MTALLLTDDRRHASIALEVSRALNREDKDDGAILQKGLGEFGLITWCSRPDAFLLRNFQVPDVAAFHNKVSD